ncbi:MAG TPA: response regulator [Gemmatimonadaceae bacterium]|nr:response regulator [Gemmatimonadaceae bacterium]
MMTNSSKTIAVVEDDPGVRMALEQLLRSAGFHALTFESAEAFLARSDSRDVACLIADINLPGISGVDLIKRLGTNGNRLPAVLITGRRDAQTTELARQVGEIPRLYKPFSDAALFEVINLVINR